MEIKKIYPISYGTQEFSNRFRVLIKITCLTHFIPQITASATNVRHRRYTLKIRVVHRALHI